MNALEATDLREWAVANRDMTPHIETLTRYASEAQIIVEFGVRGAVSTWALLDGLPPGGRMWSMDVDDCVVPPRVSSDPRWSFIRGSDLDGSVWSLLPEQADLVFIDTTHEYKHTEMELRLALTLKPARVLCHDAEWPGVERAVHEVLHQGWSMEGYYPAGDERGPFGLVSLTPPPWGLP